MKIHAALVPQTEVHAAIAEALKDPKTAVYADTSILFWLFRLNRAAFEEFRTWVTTNAAGRFFIPVWCAHELQGYIQRDQGALTKLPAEIRQTESRLREVAKYAREAADERQWGDHYDTKDSYLAALHDAGERFLRLCNIAIFPGAFSERATTLVPFVNDHLLSSNIFPFLKWIGTDYAARVEGRVPPGWKDEGSKQENRYGDLMIWNELIEHCKDKDFTSVVYLTNDNKPDWVFRPKVAVGNDVKNNEGVHETLLTSPLLAHELSSISNVANFHLLNSNALVVVLHRYVNHAVPELFASAQPLGPSGPTRAVRSKRGRSASGAPPSQGANDNPTDPVFEETAAAIPSIQSLLAELDAPSETFTRLVTALGDQDPQTQATAVAEILGGAAEPLPALELFKLGRAVGQAARQQLQTAVDMLHAYNFAPETIAPWDPALYAGALFDFYFDPANTQRPRPLDGNVEAVLAGSHRPEFSDAVAAVVGHIGGAEHYLLLPKPGGPAPTLALQFVTSPGEPGQRAELQQILFGMEELLEDLEPGEPDLLSAKVSVDLKANVGALLKSMAARHGVRRGWLTTTTATSTKLTWLPAKGFRAL